MDEGDDDFDEVDIDDGDVVNSWWSFFLLSFTFLDNKDDNFDNADIGDGDDNNK